MLIVTFLKQTIRINIKVYGIKSVTLRFATFKFKVHSIHSSYETYRTNLDKLYAVKYTIGVVQFNY